MYYVVEWYKDNTTVVEEFKTLQEAEEYAMLLKAANETFGVKDSMAMIVQD